MFKCKKCNSMYLRESDFLGCCLEDAEEPLISVGQPLIDYTYDEPIEIICYAIKFRGSNMVYYFEWFDEEFDEWRSAYAIHSNSCLIENFGDQLT
ncbi:hypothetical protein D3C74_373960 [compost metagenome]